MTTLSRHHVLLGTTAAALTVAGAACAQTAVNSGGSTLASPTYQSAFQLYSVVNGTADYGDYYFPSGSGAAQTAILNNVTNGSATTPGAATPFELGASDATATQATQLYGAAGWNNSATGKRAAGLLVIVPSIGTPITIPVHLAGVASNTAINFSDNDLCGIFSGKLTQWSQITDAGIPPNEGAITVAYRFDGSGTSFLTTQHLAAVCNASNSNITFAATTTFAGLFPGGNPPSNFKPGTGSPGVQGVIAANASSVGYLSPDYTKIIAKPTGGASAPYVAEVKGVQPTPGATQTALATGTPATDPVVNPGRSAFNVADPNSFIPVAANPSAGYPIVGYTTLWAAQCYADPNVATAIKGFIQALYRNAPTRSLEQQSGFTPLPTNLVSTVSNTYLTAAAGASTINGTGVAGCAGIAGR